MGALLYSHTSLPPPLYTILYLHPLFLAFSAILVLSRTPSFTLLLLIFVYAFVLFIAFLFSRLLSNPISLHFVVCTSIYCAYFYIIYYVIFFICCSVNITYSTAIHVTRSLTLLRLQCSNLHQLLKLLMDLLSFEQIFFLHIFLLCRPIERKDLHSRLTCTRAKAETQTCSILIFASENL